MNPQNNNTAAGHQGNNTLSADPYHHPRVQDRFLAPTDTTGLPVQSGGMNTLPQATALLEAKMAHKHHGHHGAQPTQNANYAQGGMMPASGAGLPAGGISSTTVYTTLPTTTTSTMGTGCNTCSTCHSNSGVGMAPTQYSNTGAGMAPAQYSNSGVGMAPAQYSNTGAGMAPTQYSNTQLPTSGMGSGMPTSGMGSGMGTGCSTCNTCNPGMGMAPTQYSNTQLPTSGMGSGMTPTMGTGLSSVGHGSGYGIHGDPVVLPSHGHAGATSGGMGIVDPHKTTAPNVQPHMATHGHNLHTL